jgi:hypothetical protein
MNKHVLILMMLFLSCNTPQSATNQNLNKIVLDPIKAEALQKINNEKKAISAAQKQQKGPLLIIANKIELNNYNTPFAYIKLYNNTEKTIKAFSLHFSCFDTFNKPVTYAGVNIYKGIAQNAALLSKSSDEYSWRLGLHQNTRIIKNIKIISIKYNDGVIIYLH